MSKLFLSRRAMGIGLVCGMMLTSSTHADTSDASQALDLLSVAGQQGSIVLLDLNADARDDLASRSVVRIDDLPIAVGRTIDVELTRHNVWSADARIVVETEDGSVLMDAPEAHVFGGAVEGDPDSIVVLSVWEDTVQGYIAIDNDTYIISSGPTVESRAIVAYELGALPEGAITWTDMSCHAGLLAGMTAYERAPHHDGQSIAADPPCRLMSMAIETDREYTLNLFGDNTDAAAAYIATLFGACSEIYSRDVNVTFSIDYLRLWTTTDPWTQNNTVDQLYQYRSYWNNNMTDIERNLGHFLSGRGLGGGVAWLNAVCSPDYGYGLSANLGGYFPYPIEDNNSQNWDLMVVNHEIGHNCGAPHTHDMSPPIDGCAYGDCSVTPNGTIMSYCHTCPGGLSNVKMNFHPRIIDETMLPFLDTAWCMDELDGPVFTEQPEGGSFCPDDTVVLSATASGADAYQWRRNGADLPGATDATLTITNIGDDDAGIYDVVASNGCGDAVSDAVAVSVETLVGDIDMNNIVDLSDLGILLAAFETTDEGDLDGDGDTDLADLGALLANFGLSCG
jgi:hypothetical protein